VKTTCYTRPSLTPLCRPCASRIPSRPLSA
jgi:hypothetical protein